MLEGYLDDTKRPKIQVCVDGKSSTLSITALIDTKFDGDLCLPMEVAVQLGLEPSEVVEVRKSDGKIVKTLIFAGKLEWFQELIDVDIVLHDSSEALLGTHLLEKTRMGIDYLENRVFIEKLM